MTKRVAHTASFLQTFHTGRTTADRRADVGAEGSEPRPVAASEAQAVAFVTNRPARQANTYTATYQGGIEVLHGDGLITEAQAKYVVSIALSREGVTDDMLESLKARLLQGFAKFAASQFISTYKDLPRKAQDAARAEAIAPGAPTEAVKVADGRYAVEHEGTLKFFKLKNGRNPGYVFLDVQASDDWYPVRNPGKIAEITTLIAADELSAARRYGMELGKCSRCGRTLTDETSRAYGIGPDCRAK